MLASTISGDVTGAANKTLLTVLSSADRRPRIKKIIIGCTDGTPTDTMVKFALRRLTADGTGTAVTPMTADSANGATPSCTSKKNYTVEPTYATGTLAELPVHQRGTYEFTPDLDQEWAAPIGAGAGLGLVLITNSTKSYAGTIIWDE